MRRLRWRWRRRTLRGRRRRGVRRFHQLRRRVKTAPRLLLSPAASIRRSREHGRPHRAAALRMEIRLLPSATSACRRHRRQPRTPPGAMRTTWTRSRSGTPRVQGSRTAAVATGSGGASMTSQTTQPPMCVRRTTPSASLSVRSARRATSALARASRMVSASAARATRATPASLCRAFTSDGSGRTATTSAMTMAASAPPVRMLPMARRCARATDTT